MDLLKQVEQLNRRVGEPQGFTLLRAMAAKNFASLKWPTRKLENWRYSPVQKLQTDFVPQINLNGDLDKDLKINLTDWLKPILRSDLVPVVLLNGEWINAPDVSLELGSHSIYEIKSIKKALEQGNIDSSDFVDGADNKLEALNISYLDQGYVILIRANGTTKAKPLQIIHLHMATDSQPLFQSRLMIKTEAHSKASLLESHYVLDLKSKLSSMPSQSLSIVSSATPLPFLAWNNSTTTIDINDGAEINFAQWNETPASLQATHRTKVTLHNKTHFHYLQGIHCLGWNRNELNLKVKGSNSTIEVHGVGLTKSGGIADQPSSIDFSGENNECQQIVRSLLLEQSKAIFNGHIIIRPSAQKTNSSQLHQSLLLSQDAEVDTKPELEIYADDVKATHGAAVGQLNADELFYFQSRGISKERAHHLMCVGFLSELCEKFPESSIKNYLMDQIKQIWINESKDALK